MIILLCILWKLWRVDAGYRKLQFLFFLGAPSCQFFGQILFFICIWIWFLVSMFYFTFTWYKYNDTDTMKSKLEKWVFHLDAGTIFTKIATRARVPQIGSKLTPKWRPKRRPQILAHLQEYHIWYDIVWYKHDIIRLNIIQHDRIWCNNYFLKW